MKIIDQTPFYKENGELSLVDRGKAIMKYGLGWFKEIEAQNSVLPVFDKILDRNYTLLRNVVPPELGVTIPFILVGPTGVFVMDVTPLVGMYRAKGDQWGSVVGSTYKPQNPNLLTHTERMARAIQLYLQRQGFIDVSSVEAVLICSDPAVTVDSLRPIIRVVMRDALERFIVSISQARIILTPETARTVVKRILNPAPAPEPAPVEPPSPDAQDAEPYVPDFAQPGSVTSPATGSLLPTSESASSAVSEAMPRRRSRRAINRKQMILLIVMFIFWCLIAAVFAYLVARNLFF